MMTHLQFRSLLRAASGCRHRNARRDWFMFYLLGKTGLRISEALALRVEDLYLDQAPAFLRVRTLKQRAPRKRLDDVLIEASTARELRKWMHLRPRHGKTLVLPGMSRFRASELFRFYARLANLPDGMTLHSLRHYRGSFLFSSTGDLLWTQEQMRHSSITSTEVYLHTDPARVAGHLDALEREGR